jgi:seryl-tRNA synthetase
MSSPQAGTLSDAYRQYTDELIAHGLLIPQGVRGLYGRGGVMEDVIERFERLVTSVGANDGADVMRFSPIINRKHFERSDYLKSFPDMAGSVHSFEGTDKDHAALLAKLERGEDWSIGLPATDVVLTPAACYPVYPTLTGTLPRGGRLVDVLSFVFRHEPSDDPARQQMFRQREYVRIGHPDECRAHRDLWLERGQELLRRVGLPVKVDLANDPFFGRAGKMLAANQRDQNLKFELLVPICSEEKPTACTSCNYHQEHFGHSFGIHTADGETAHTACVGFGLERIALALFKHHGFRTAQWPASVRNALGL